MSVADTDHSDRFHYWLWYLWSCVVVWYHGNWGSSDTSLWHFSCHRFSCMQWWAKLAVLSPFDRCQHVSKMLVTEADCVCYPTYCAWSTFTSFVVQQAVKQVYFISSFITDCISVGGNAIVSVHLSIRPSICFHSVFRTDWPLTLNFCVQVNHDHSSQGIEGQGHGSG